MSLTTPFSVQKLQMALYMQKRRNRPTFVSMRCTTRCIGKMFWPLPTNAVKLNGGAAGVDNQTFENIEAYEARNGGRTNWRKS